VQSVKNITVTKSNIITSLRDDMAVPNPRRTFTLVISDARNLFTFEWTAKSSSDGCRSSGSLNSIPTDTAAIALSADARMPQVCHLRRLVVEDLLLLVPSRVDPYLLLVSSTHPLVRWYTKVQSELATPLPLFSVASKETYLQLALFVTGNARRTDFLRGLLNHSMFEHLLLGNGNTGINVSYHGSTANDYALPFNEFIDGTLQLWGRLPYSRDWRTALKNKSNPDSRQRLFSCLCFELHGDIASLLQLGATNAAIALKVTNRLPLLQQLRRWTS
jgi:hypothetical protein